MSTIIEYFWDYYDIFQSKTINSINEINNINEVPIIFIDEKIYKPVFMTENTEDKIKTLFVYCKEDDTKDNNKQNYKSNLSFNKHYNNIYLIPNIFRILNYHCIKNRLPLDSYHIVNNFIVNFEVVNAKEEEYKMIKYMLLKLLNMNGFNNVDIKNENEIKNNYSRMLKNLNELNYIR